MKYLKETPGGVKKNSIFEVKFEEKAHVLNKQFSPFGQRYNFSLEQSIDDCPEYLAHQPTLQTLASQYGLELVQFQNFHPFFHKYSNKHKYPDHFDLLTRMDVLNKDNFSIKADDWTVAGVYSVFVFKKCTDIDVSVMHSNSNISRIRVPGSTRSATESDVIRIV
jgi:mRNA (guanine-N7-)-methyltransferase